MKVPGHFLIWDNEGSPPSGDWTVVLWRSFGDTGDSSAYSLPCLVEEQSDALRARLLSWIHDLGEAQIRGCRIVDHMELRPGFSCWWMSLLAEKSYGKLARLFDAVRLFALDKLLDVHSVGRIVLVSGDPTLADAFQRWCRNANLVFEWRKLVLTADAISLSTRFYRSLPRWLQALISLARYLMQRWPFRDDGKCRPSDPAAVTTFVDYLFHFDSKVSMETGRYASKYWTDLIGVLDEEAVPVNWLHHFMAHDQYPSAAEAKNLFAHFNQNRAGTQSHGFLDGTISCGVIWSAIRDFGRLVWAELRMRNASIYFRPAGSRVDLWPLFKNDWKDSLSGSTAILNCLFLNQIESILARLPRQKLGVYLQENQGWEMALIHAWKAAGHRRLVGVPHATIRYWDLRYFSDPRSLRRTGMNDLPLPDTVALNGPAAFAAYQKGGYFEEYMVEVEAVRYLFLADYLPAKRIAPRDTNEPLRVLVLGDYLPGATRSQMQWLAEAEPSLPVGTLYIVKPHPDCSMKATDYPGLQLQITEAPLSELLGLCDVAYSSNITSAAVDAYLAGVPVVSVLDGNAFNMSPLRGSSAVQFVSNPTELARALLNTKKSLGFCADAFFHLDKQLPRWRSLLEMRGLKDRRGDRCQRDL